MIAAKKEPAPIEAGERKSIPIELLMDSPFNPRKTFNAKKVSDIAASMKQLGQLQPIVVRSVGGDEAAGEDAYEIAAGHTRKRAAAEAGIHTLDAIVRELSDEEMIVVGLVENGDREDLPPLEEADAYAELEKRGWSVQRICDQTGKSEAHVRRRLQITKVIPEARQAVAEGKLLANAAALLARLENPADQKSALERALGRYTWDADDKPLSGDDIESVVRSTMRVLTDAPFDVTDAKLVKGAKPCAQCPKRTGAQVEMYPEVVDDKDRCVDSVCWDAKLRAHDEARVEGFKKRGLTILTSDESERVFVKGATYPAPPFIALDHECFTHPNPGTERKTWRELVGASPKGVFVAFDGEGRPREVMKEADARKAAGFKEPTKPSAPSPSPSPRLAATGEREDDFDDTDEDDGHTIEPPAPPPPVRALEEEHAIVAAIVDRCVRKQDVAVWKMLRSLVDPDADFDAIAKRRGWSHDQIDDRYVSPTGIADAVGLLVEALVAGPMLEDQRTRALALLGLDEAEILGKLKAKKAKVKAKAAEKKARKPVKKKPAKKASKRR